MLPGTFIEIVFLRYFTLLLKLLAKLSHLHPSTMVSVDYHSSGIPSLSTMSSPDRNDIELSWMIVVCLGAGWGP
jgi:hypothetical protein